MTALKEYITDGLKRGTLQRSEAPDACSFFFINKKDGKLRPIQDYRLLNAITQKNAAPIPLILELIDKLLGARFFTKLDVHWGYNNIRIWEGDKYKMAFKTPLGLFESCVMTFRLCNALATFQTFMDTQFADFLTTSKVVIYLDDILIMAQTLVELVKLTHRILQRLLDLDLYLRPKKCSFNQTSVEYLCYDLPLKFSLPSSSSATSPPFAVPRSNPEPSPTIIFSSALPSLSPPQPAQPSIQSPDQLPVMSSHQSYHLPKYNSSKPEPLPYQEVHLPFPAVEPRLPMPPIPWSQHTCQYLSMEYLADQKLENSPEEDSPMSDDSPEWSIVIPANWPSQQSIPIPNHVPAP